MTQEIVIDFFPNGKMSVEAFGFEGNTCMEAVEFLNKIGTRTELKMKEGSAMSAPVMEKMYAR